DESAGAAPHKAQVHRADVCEAGQRIAIKEGMALRGQVRRLPLPREKRCDGFVPQVRREVASKFKGLEIDTCPFSNLPEKKRTQWALTREEMKNCVWLKPQLVTQIEFTEWTPDGHLRHSKFVGLRQDKDPEDVVREM